MPSLARIFRIVSKKPSFAAGLDSDEPADIVWTAWDVCITQMGLLVIVVADPLKMNKLHRKEPRNITCDESNQHGLQGAQGLSTSSCIQDNFPRPLIEIIVHSIAEFENTHGCAIRTAYPLVTAMPNRLEFRPLYRPAIPSFLIIPSRAWRMDY
jgi:hypothetical protein